MLAPWRSRELGPHGTHTGIDTRDGTARRRGSRVSCRSSRPMAVSRRCCSLPPVSSCSRISRIGLPLRGAAGRCCGQACSPGEAPSRTPASPRPAASSRCRGAPWQRRGGCGVGFLFIARVGSRKKTRPTLIFIKGIKSCAHVWAPGGDFGENRNGKNNLHRPTYGSVSAGGPTDPTVPRHLTSAQHDSERLPRELLRDALARGVDKVVRLVPQPKVGRPLGGLLVEDVAAAVERVVVRRAVGPSSRR